MAVAVLSRELASDRRGATAIEFAIMGPVFFMFLFGIVECGLCYTANIMLQSATNTAARTGRTGYIDDSSTRDATVRRIVKDQSSIILDYTKLTLSSKAY